MDIWQIITLIVIPATVGVFTWLTTKYLPAKQAEVLERLRHQWEAEQKEREAKLESQRTELEFRLKQAESNQNYEQNRELEAFHQMVNISETLISSLVGLIDDMRKMLGETRAAQIEILGKISIVLMDWSKIVESLEDIDIHYHEIAGHYKVFIAHIEQLSRAIEQINRQDQS